LPSYSAKSYSSLDPWGKDRTVEQSVNGTLICTTFGTLKFTNRSSHYWQGLADHTALRIRKFGRLQGYKKAKARYYKLVVILDDRTSDICRALAVQDKFYPQNDVLDVMDNLMALDTKSNSLDDAREYIKALAPWIKDNQIESDSEMNQVGVSGAHTPFLPFHWKCRMTTVVLL